MIRKLIEQFTPDARRSLGAFPGVYEIHVNPDDEGEFSGGLMTAPPSVFIQAWDYRLGDAAIPPDVDEKQFIAVVHGDGVVLTELES